MAEFPCGICNINCENEVIQCSECELWFYSKCLGMLKSALKSWSVKTLRFFCGACSFVGELYDAGKALQRYLFIHLFFLFIYITMTHM